MKRCQKIDRKYSSLYTVVSPLYHLNTRRLYTNLSFILGTNLGWAMHERAEEQDSVVHDTKRCLMCNLVCISCKITCHLVESLLCN